MKRAALAAPLLALCLTASACGGTGEPDPGPGPTTASPRPTSTSPTPSPPVAGGTPRVIGTVASGLEVPWGIAFLPDGAALVTERDSGWILRVERGREPQRLRRIEATSPEGEAGLLGIALSPDRSHYFVYVSTASDNRVLRGTTDGRRLGEPEPILTGIPNGFIHDGGRLAFGPDGYLYVSTGETGEADLAQDRDSLAGKILRITEDGEPAPGNPFIGADGADEIWSWGHRNVQGLAFDGDGNLWASEFGSSSWDELNKVVKGGNHGWPTVEGRSRRGGLENPQVIWRTDEASPSGLAFENDYLWLAALRGARLWRIRVDSRGNGAEPIDFLVGDHGRLRTVAVAPDGNLWLTTSNRDGRGNPADSDDRILLVRPR